MSPNRQTPHQGHRRPFLPVGLWTSLPALLGVSTLLLCPACVSELEEPDPKEHCDTSLPQAVAQVTLEPREAPPGGAVNVLITLPQPSGEEFGEVEAWVVVNDGAPGDEFELVAVDGELSAHQSLTAPTAGGDHLVLIEGWAGERCLVGAALLPVSPAAPCPTGQTLELGACVELRSGTPLSQLDSQVPGPTPGDGANRPMVHPRATVILSDRRAVHCFMDSVAVLHLDEPISGTLPEYLLEAETPLRYCDHLAVDEQRGIAVISSRGTEEWDGGLASLSFPLSTEPAETEPTYLHAVLDSAGFEEIAVRDGLIYAAGKPDRLLVFELSADGSMALASETQIPNLKSAWSVLLDDDHLYLSSAGGGGADDVPGEVLVFTLNDPLQPTLVGRLSTMGPAKSLAQVDEGVVAVASGQGGLSLVDVTDPSTPFLLSTVQTPGSALAVAHEEGYLLLADWDSLRLYDATDRGVLRFLGSSDFRPSQGGGPRHGDQGGSTGLVATAAVTMTGREFVIDEFVKTIRGEILPGHRGVRFILPSPHIVFTADDVGQTLPRSFELRNSGTESMTVEATMAYDLSQALPEGAFPDMGPLLVPPMSSKIVSVDIEVPAPGGPTAYIRFDSNDPQNPVLGAEVEVVEDNYAIGDEQPRFALPLFNECGPSGCTTESRCFDTANVEEIGRRPMVLAFFSSW